MKIDLPKAFEELFKPSRYKAYHGGRGSGKSHSFASALVLRGAKEPRRFLCCREIQKSIKDSSKRLIDDKIDEYGLRWFYESTETEIRGKNGTLFLFAGLRSNPESIKSMEAIDVAWVDEADKASQRSLDLLIPTIRQEGSELWFSWNPNDELDPVDQMFRGRTPPPDSVVRQVNYSDNPFFPSVLKQEADFDRLSDPQKYEHVWLGGYRQAEKGAYYAKQIVQSIEENRITHVPHDPLLPVYCAFDLGMADLTTVWFYQFVGQEVHFIDYYESQYTSVADDASFLNKKPYTYEKLILPHDGRAKQKGTGKSTEEVFKGLGFDVEICPNIGIMEGINYARAVFPKCWFDSDKCAQGLKALKAYHEEYDDDLKVGKKPLHDWSSHASDAFRYFAVSKGKYVKSNLVEQSSAYARNFQTPPTISTILEQAQTNKSFGFAPTSGKTP